MTDDLRRQDDALLTGIGAEVALLRQAHELGTKATDNALGRLEKSIETLALKIDNVNAGLAEPTASPAGRALQKQIDEHDLRIDILEKGAENDALFRTEVITAFRTLRVQLSVVGTIIGIVAGAAAVLATVHHP